MHPKEVGHDPRKRFGQNFLCDSAVIHNIVKAIHPLPDQNMVEIGPGLGALTAPLIEKIGRLSVVELDRDLIPHLEAQFGDRILVFAADALKFDFGNLGKDKKLRVVGNLPYNISTPLLFHLMTYAKDIEDMHFMLQKEVVERIVAAPDSEHYGRLSVMLQYHCAAHALFLVPRSAFRPMPKVESMIVRLVPYATKPFIAKEVNKFSEVVKLAFSQRRKTLSNTLKPLFTRAQLSALNIDPQARGETLSVEDYVKLANSLTP